MTDYAIDVDPENYSYTYPRSAIAQSPAHPRTSARLLVYDSATKKHTISTFADLARFLPSRAVLVFNETRVVPARLYAYKPSGGKVELLYLSRSNGFFTALANRSLPVGMVLSINKAYRLTIVRKLEKGYAFKPNFPLTKLFSVLERVGVTPIPPYIKHATLTEKRLREEYQTVFAKTRGSSAAPTASLHFTTALLAKLKRLGVAVEYVTLHVGLGTFAPLTQQQLTSGKLHHEYYEISPQVAKRLEKYKAQGRPIVAVGTTVVRTLESAGSKAGKLTKLSGNTNLFIHPPYSFKFVSGLITNFHVPKSSLMMLVASLVGREKLLELYKFAVKKKFRLFSFGDGMLIK